MSLLRSKIATSFYFLSGGGSLALWAVHIPLIQEKVGVDYSALGLLLMVSGLGGFLAMQIAGWMVDHIGARTTTMFGGITIALSLLGPAFANSPFWLGLAIFGIGFGLSAVDVPMNAAALQVERANKKPIFTFFHLFWSLGGLIGAGIGFVTIGAGFTQEQTLVVACIVLAALAILLSGWLLPNEPVANSDDKVANKASSKANRRVLGFVILAGGDNEGVVPGSMLNVVRAGKVIAKLRVTAVEAGRSAADIVVDSMSADTMLRAGDEVVAEEKLEQSSNELSLLTR